MASSKALVLTMLLTTILVFSLKVNASRELNEQTHNKVSKGPENEEKLTTGIGFIISDNNNNGGNTVGGNLPGNGYPGMGYNGGRSGLPFFGGGPGYFGGDRPGYFGGFPGNGGYIGNP
ncbi:hypothetical protein IHE45_08G054800 [Dioscorea alata]|uniref:Uncharacterized protein n=1 Tax=Dioscorea alata TaxID=55571 RepID=A0ACB7VJB6_DIOAL|nr:hypothetical protein IHE45_08G054800 [Dioscorea alata]